jgi:hypothetical protein
MRSDVVEGLSKLRRHPPTWALPVVVPTPSNLEHAVVESYRQPPSSERRRG